MFRSIRNPVLGVLLGTALAAASTAVSPAVSASAADSAPETADGSPTDEHVQIVTAGTSDWQLLVDTPGLDAARDRVDLRRSHAQIGRWNVAIPAGGAVRWDDPNGHGTGYLRLLHGHLMLRDLAVLARNGDPDAAELAMAIIDDWAANNNVRGSARHHMAWHDETTAQRVLSWLEVYDVIDADGRARIRGLLTNHIRTLLDDDFHTTGTNHGMFQDRAILAWTGHISAHDPLAATARQTAARRLTSYFRASVSSEGVHLEHSPAYHQVIFGNLNRIASFLGDDATALQQLRGDMLDYAIHVLQPDGSWPLVGDTGTHNRPAASLSDDPRYRFALTGGQQGTAPANIDAFYPDADYAIMRSGWTPDDTGTYLHFTAAYHHHYHKNADDLSLWLYHDGDLLTAAGPNNYTYDDPFTVYAYGAASHNVILVDGEGVPRHDERYGDVELTHTSTSPTRAQAAGTTHRLPAASWTRGIDYRRPSVETPGATDRITVTDQVSSRAGRRDVELRWHTAPGVDAKVRTDGSVALVRAGVIVANVTVTDAGRAITPRVQRARADASAGWRLGGESKTPVDTMSFHVSTTQATLTTEIELLPTPAAAFDITALCGSTSSSNRPFGDVSGTHATAISCAGKLGLMQGRTTTSFAPQQALSRAQMTSLIVRLLETQGVDTTATTPSPFTDVTRGPHANAIAWAAEQGIVQGLSSTRFDPDAAVTRAQLATIIDRAIGDRAFGEGTSAPVRFVDVHGVHAAGIARMHAAGIVSGDGVVGYQPSKTVTRAQAASIIVRTAQASR